MRTWVWKTVVTFLLYPILLPILVVSAIFVLIWDHDWEWFLKNVIKDDLRRILNPRHTFDVFFKEILPF